MFNSLMWANLAPIFYRILLCSCGRALRDEKTGADDDNPLLRVIVFRVDKRFCRIIQSENGIDGNARKKFAPDDQSLRRNLGTVFRQKLKVPLSLARPSRPKRK
jgi:hypothetical protein